MMTDSERIEQWYLETQTDSNRLFNLKEQAIINALISELDQGSLRIAEKIQGGWHTHTWLKKAVLLYFRIQENTLLPTDWTRYYDKIPSKFQNYTLEDFQKCRLRVVPPAAVRQGAYIGPRSVLMPSYVNIGAYVDEGCMIDTWATVGSCAQIGKNVHLSGGAGIGGVLEPLQTNPTIIEDHCFIGARSEIVEGVIVEEGSVIAMGVFISQSTPIYDRHTRQISYGRIPPYSVVVPGTLPSTTGDYQRAAAIIVKTVDARTRDKTSINVLLRE